MRLDPLFSIPNTTYKEPPFELQDKKTYPEFQDKLEKFKSLIKEKHSLGQSVTFYKFGDGDFYFLKQKRIGSAKPGSRALSRKLSKKELSHFKNGAQRCDYYLCELESTNQNRFRQVIDKQIDFPSEFVYGLLANRWMLETFSGQIGLIGADRKLDIIRLLMMHREVQSFYKTNSFCDYIRVPQKFACDNAEVVQRSVQSQLEHATAKVFLVGVGHLKSAILHNLPKLRPAMYIDVGSGIDALAGMIDTRRPYFGNWQNFRLANDEIYENIDYLNFNFENITSISEQPPDGK
jgi:hypothetical protein